MLAAEHAVRRPQGLRALSNSPASTDLWATEAGRLRAEIPFEVAAVLDRHEADGTTQHSDYEAASRLFYDRHVCRAVPNPPEVTHTFELLAHDLTVHPTMNRPNEFHGIGTLRSWSIVERAGRMVVPALLLAGRYDPATPATVERIAAAIPDVRWVGFQGSRQMPVVEESNAYLSTVADFLGAND